MKMNAQPTENFQIQQRQFWEESLKLWVYNKEKK
jgi:hypothetical protein